MEDARPTAFVAMSFDNDHWRDKRYIAIREELEHAGFTCVRADEISTSGQAADEVCRLLRESALVVIDSSGDSPNVSYEVGYCHGVGRAPSKTLLLRSDPQIPFTYQHYRHRIYKDLRHLRRLVRDYLKIYEPIRDDMYGYAFTFEYSKDVHVGYILDGAICIFNALRDCGFTGRAECYSAEQYAIGGRYFTVGIMLRRPGRDPTPNYDWWMALSANVAKVAKTLNGRIIPANDMSEMASKGAMKDAFVPCGVAEFENGAISRHLGSEDDESFFRRWLQKLASDDEEGE